jgi:hypothetical protein
VANGTPSGPRTSVKAPLVFSAVMAVVAGAVVLMVSTGGTRHVPRWDLASGIHRSSASRPRPGQPGRDADDRRQDGNG